MKTETPYFITDLARREIGFLSIADFSKCMKRNRNIYFCSKTFPLYKESEDKEYCELAILKNQQIKTEICVALPLNPKDMFIKINELNQYYFVILKPLIIKINCKENITTKVISGTGILTLNEECYCIILT